MPLFEDLGKMAYQEGIDKRAFKAGNMREDELTKRALEIQKQRDAAFRNSLSGGGQPSQPQGGLMQAAPGGQDQTMPQQGGLMGGQPEQIDPVETGLLANPYDKKTVAQFRYTAAQAGRKPEEINQYIKDARGIGQFENRNQQLTANRSLAGDFKKEVKPYRAQLEYYNTNAKLGGGDINEWTGTDDFMAIRNFMKQSLPNESVMGDDIANMKFSQGVPENVRTWISSITGEGGLSVAGRKELMDTMHSNAMQAQGYSNELRANYDQQAASVPGLNTKFFLKPIEPAAPTWRDQPDTSTAGGLSEGVSNIFGGDEKPTKSGAAAELEKRGLKPKRKRNRRGR